MDIVLVIELIALVLLFAWSAFLSIIETSLFALDTLHIGRIRRSHPKAAKRIEDLLATPTKLLSTILIGDTAGNVIISVLGYSIIARLVPAYAEVIAIPVMLVLLLLLGEVTPKKLAIRMPDRLAVLLSPFFNFPIILISPLRFLFEGITTVFKRLIRPRRKPLTGDEFLTAMVVGEEEGILDKEERSMVDGIVRLRDRQASDIMTPRMDMVGIDLNTAEDTYRAFARNTRFRYVPVYRGTLDNIEFMLDVAKYVIGGDKPLADAMMPAFYVPETMRLNALLETFQKESRRVAVVVDEYGGTAGLVTRSDVLEEIVAYVGDERNTQAEPAIEPAGRNCWLVDGGVSLEHVNRRLDLELRAEGADRIAGWVTVQMGRIPRAGETVSAQGCSITVKRVRKNRIVLVALKKEAGAETGAGTQ
ncbi:MAG: hemolysin family protein [bacterium]